ncbi:CD1375 family protein [Paenibacillus sinopodophylli]|nr:CD1375 family protein [Paenibacillus sinopodophylli]
MIEVYVKLIRRGAIKLSDVPTSILQDVESALAGA